MAAAQEPIEEKRQQEIESEAVRFTDIRKHGIMSNIDKRRTILENMKRNALKGEAKFKDVSARVFDVGQRFIMVPESPTPGPFAALVQARDKEHDGIILQHPLIKKIVKAEGGWPERLARYLGVTPGAVTVLGLSNDTARDVELYVDEEVWRAERLHAHPLVNTATVVDNASGDPVFFAGQ